MDLNRRTLLLGGAAAWAGLSGPAAGRTEPSNWSSARARFDFSGPPPLNAANLCPAYRAVLQAHGALSQRLSADVGFLNRRDVVRGEVADARQACADMLNLADADQLAFVRNTSEANAVIVHGLDLGAEDEVVLWDENHATNYASWHHRHRRRPFRVRPVHLPEDASDDAIVAAFVAALSPRTRAVSFSHLSNISGTRLPAPAICAAIRKRAPQALIHIDGAQSWGSIAVDLDEIGCDTYASSAHKWLCGPRGVGILAVRGDWAERLQPLLTAYDLEFDYPEEALPSTARRFECLGQRDTAAIGALATALEQHAALGATRIETRIAELTTHALDRFAEAGIAVRTSRGRGHGVVIADLGANYKSYGAFLALHNAGIASAFVHGNRVHCQPSGTPLETDTPVSLRICPHVYNSTDDIDAAVDIAARVRNSNFEIIKEVVRFL